MNKRGEIRVATLATIIILLLAFALRVYRLDAQSLWWDEGISLHLATSSLAQIVADRAANIHPPLYFFLLKVWVDLVGVTPFAARYSSALAALVQVAAVYALTRRLFRGRLDGRRLRAAAWTALLLVAVSPLSVVYGQEIRVYALLPLVYAALIGAAHRLAQPAAAGRRAWIGLGAAAWVGLHFHYTAAFLIAYVGGWLLLAFWRGRRWADVRRLALTGTAVGLGGLPWLAAIAANWPAVQARVSTGTFLTEPAPVPFLLSQLWVFHLTGLAGILQRPLVQALAAATALLAAGLVIWRLSRRSQARVVLPALAHWLLPLAVTLLIWSVRSFSHPRYVSMFAFGLFPLLALLVAPPRAARLGWLRRGTGMVLATAVLAISAAGLHIYFFDPAVAKPDMRGAAAYLQAQAADDDVIFIQDEDWSLSFEYQGAAPLTMPQTKQRDVMWSHLAQMTAGRRQAFSVVHARGNHDWQNVVPFALEKAGRLEQIVRFDELLVYRYGLAQAVTPPELTPVDGRFPPLRLVGQWIEAGAAADSAVTVALQWQAEQPPQQRYHTTLRLVDADGWTVAQMGDLLLDENGRPTEQWPAGHTTTTYHVLPLPPGTPPLTYRVTVDLFSVVDGSAVVVDVVDAAGAPQGRQLALGAATLRPAERPGGNPYQIVDELPRLAQPLTAVAGIQLLAAAPDREALSPGQSLFVQLLWQAQAGDLPALALPLALVQDGQTLAVDEGGVTATRYPTGQWREGELVREVRRLAAPPGSAGAAQLVLRLPQGDAPLAQVMIRAGVHSFQPPPVQTAVDVTFGGVARLVGYDLEGERFFSDAPVPLTLYWESLVTGTAVEYVVFAHLLDGDGRLIGQHDAPPANGQRPTTGWVAGEYIEDEHPMTFRQPGYTGPARIEVGLYDPQSGARLVTADGRDHVILPVALQIGDR